jgi:replicative DNA helicase
MPSDFYHEPLSIAFAACQTLYNRHEPINQITLAQELDRIGKLETCGGVAYLSYLISIVPTPLDCDSYAGVVTRLAICRRAIDLARKIADVGFAAGDDAQITVDTVSELVRNFRKTNGKFDEILTPHDTADVMLELMHNLKEKRNGGISWGFRDLDRITGGIHAGEFIVPGAQTSVGKSDLILDIANGIDHQGYKVFFVSLEMTLPQIKERRFSKLTHKDILTLRKSGIGEVDEKLILNDIGVTAVGNTYFLTGNLTSQQIYDKAAWLKDRVGLDVVFVDYLQKIRDCSGWGETQNVRVGRVSNIMKEITIENNCAVITPSQFNRELERSTIRDNKEESDEPAKPQRPHLSDLRDSGCIEQDADIVFLLWRNRNGKAHDGTANDSSMLWLKMEKNRQLGPAPAIELRWSSELLRYVDYPPDSTFAQTQPMFEDEQQ